MVNLTIEEITQYWLLTSAVDFPRALGYFFPELDDIALNMREVPGLNAGEYAKVLLNLFDLEMIEFSSELLEDDVTTRSGIMNILDRFLEFSNENPNALMIRRTRQKSVADPYAGRTDLKVRFRLTEKGGETWEAIAKPNWKKFLEGFSDTEGEGEGLKPSSAELASQDLSLVLAHLGWFREEWTESIVYGPQFDSINLQFHEEYQALYWKRLPSVYKATFALTPVQPLWTKGPNGEPNWHQAPKWFSDWRSTSRKWFTEPWELPDWPS